MLSRRALLGGLAAASVMPSGIAMAQARRSPRGWIEDQWDEDLWPAEPGPYHLRGRSAEKPDGFDPRRFDPGGPVLDDEAAPEAEWYTGWIDDEPFDIPKVDLSLIDPRFHRGLVDFDGPEQPGTLAVDTRRRLLFLVREDGSAIRYGVGVGRLGFSWAGTARVARKARWPSWRPPPEMRRRRPDLPSRMPGGIDNPLGARALYLYEGERDTLYRIHGTNEPWTIGKAVSSGCIRMLNEDVLDLHGRVPLGTVVVVREHSQG